MPLPILTASAVIQCCHGGKVQPVPKQTKVFIMGQPVLTFGDFAPAPVICPVVPSGPTKPCTTATTPAPAPGGNVAAKVMVMGKPVHVGMGTFAPAITDGAPVPCPSLIVASPGQQKVMAT